MNADPLPARAARNLINVIIDTPKGSRNKYKYDAQAGCFKLSHILPLGMRFPSDFGSVPHTLAADGDPLDVLVLLDEPTFPGCLLSVKFIGVIAAEQTQKSKTVRNDRILAVAETPVNRSPLAHIKEIENVFLEELEQFFVNYNRLHGRIFKPLGRSGPQAAERLLKDAMRSFEQQS